jgi:hypothetical protein
LFSLFIVFVLFVFFTTFSGFSIVTEMGSAIASSGTLPMEIAEFTPSYFGCLWWD